MTVIRVRLDHEDAVNRLANLMHFIDAQGLAPGVTQAALIGNAAESAMLPSPYTRVPDRDEAILEAGFLGANRAANQAVLRHLNAPKLFVGKQPLPDQLTHVCVPFEGRRVRAPWLRRVLTEAARLKWRVRLCYCDRALVPAGIMRLADWLHVESVKKALAQWLTEDVQTTLRDWIDEFPNTEVHSEIGSPRAVLADEDPQSTLIMSSFEAGFHLPFGHRGAYYAGLLVKTGFTGYFIP